MRKLAASVVVFLIGIFMLTGVESAFAKGKGGGEGRGKPDTGEIPAGFSQGEKKGWKGESVPPGWSHGKKKGWKDAKMPPGLASKTGEAKPPQPAETEGKK